MHCLFRFRWLTFPLIFSPAATLAIGGEAWGPFHLPWESPAGAIADARFLLDAPAGKHGPLVVRDGHFHFENGKRVKFWGVNLSGEGCVPPPEVAMKADALLPALALTACLLLPAPAALATFSIAAVDLETGEVGSAGASCISGSIILSDVHPGVGVIHTQAYWNSQNQQNARNLMNIVEHLRSIVQLAQWTQRRGIDLARWDDS